MVTNASAIQQGMGPHSLALGRNTKGKVSLESFWKVDVEKLDEPFGTRIRCGKAPG
jgi:hypothetical protein